MPRGAVLSVDVARKLDGLARSVVVKSANSTSEIALLSLTSCARVVMEARRVACREEERARSASGAMTFEARAAADDMARARAVCCDEGRVEG
jgi:hypothetical protein